MTNPTTPSSPPPDKRRRVDRVAAACDLCKTRKVKCNGEQPCSYCTSRKRASFCVFSSGRARNAPRPSRTTPEPPTEPAARLSPTSVRSHASRDQPDDGYTVPLDGRLLRDAQGKNIFIGDCAPLSFLQTVRHLITSEIDPGDISLPHTRDAVIEAAPSSSNSSHAQQHPADVSPRELSSIVARYEVATSGLVDLFDPIKIHSDVKECLRRDGDVAVQATYFLVLAIGVQEADEKRADSWFQYARNLLMNRLFNSMTVLAVQGFTLVAIYMLRASQPNGAYLYFSLAARTAYAIGIHRAEVNASFGAAEDVLRSRLWKSLRCVDMLISSSLGRPPSTSDVDCTVKYFDSVPTVQEATQQNLLDASTQMFMIIERVVVEVYSRKRISLRIAKYVSHQHKKWASRWLSPLAIALEDDYASAVVRTGACQTLCSYYYGIMLLSRPFLFYHLYEYLGSASSSRPTAAQAEHEEKRKFADAALDAAVTLIDTLQLLTEPRLMPLRMPMIVSWLFAASLTLAIGVLGHEGYLYEKPCRTSIRCLQYFAEIDPHARQYSQIIEAILEKTRAWMFQRETQLRHRRRQAASQLFGMLPANQPEPQMRPSSTNAANGGAAHSPAVDRGPDTTTSDWTMYDGDFFALPWLNENDAALQDFLQPGRQGVDGSSADVPLFPLDDPMALILSSNTGIP